MIKKVLATVVVIAFAVGSAAMVAPLFFLRPEKLRSDAAHAPAPTRLRIPSIGVDAPVEPDTATATGALTLPGDLTWVGWYSQGVHPGQAGDAVIAGRVDASGVAALARLGEVRPGSRIDVEMTDGATLTFEVARAESYAGNRQPADLFARSGTPRLSLIASGRSRVVVEATLRPAR
ncbi:MAG: class F sortase [Chloroflexi bacterium]|nr:MAG: class F sortase [Chloroflexota bacterium]